MGFPIMSLAVEKADGNDKSIQCFNIEVELEFWLSNRDRLKWSRHKGDERLLIELIKFAYDGYILYGGAGHESSWAFLMTRFKASKLSKRVRGSCAETVLAEVWGRAYGS